LKQPVRKRTGCSHFPKPVFLHVIREVYLIVTLYSTTGMSTIARDLGHVLAFGVSAVIAAIFRISAHCATAHFVSTFTFICHVKVSFVVICRAR
jgi:hypothetical protein